MAIFWFQLKTHSNINTAALASDHRCCKLSTTVISPSELSTVVNRLRCLEPVHNRRPLCPVLSWITTFISDRTQIVNFAGQQSTISVVLCGVPQGSVLGPILFLLYTADVTAIAQRHGFSAHSYADDTQLYLHE